MTDTPVNKQMKLLVEQTKLLRQSFVKASESTVKTIPRDIFVYHFFPLFSGKDYSRMEELLPIWYGIAGSANKPVDVVDSDNNVLIRVPAIQNNYLVSPITKRIAGLHYETERAVQLAQMSPVASQNQLDGAFGRVATIISNEEDQQDIEAQWNKVFEMFTVKEGKPVSVVKKQQDEEDDLEY